MNTKKPFFSTRDLVLIGFLIAVTGVFQAVWSYLVLQLGVAGPLAVIFTNVGFQIWSFVALYLVRKPGAATVVKGLGGVIEVLMGNPFGPVAILYSILGGAGPDLAFLLFRRRLSINMMIVGALFAQLLTAPLMLARDAVPLAFVPILADLSAGLVGAPLTGWLSWVVICGLRKAGLRSPYEIPSTPLQDRPLYWRLPQSHQRRFPSKTQ
jgi:energy-coupling factor transport system permease protein